MAVEIFVKVRGKNPSLARRDAERNTLGYQCRPILVAVIAVTPDEHLYVLWEHHAKGGDTARSCASALCST
jgi:hypothetical protein